MADQHPIQNDETAQSSRVATEVPHLDESTDPETKGALLSFTDSDDDQILWTACTGGETQKEQVLGCFLTSDSEDSDREQSRKDPSPPKRKPRRQSKHAHGGFTGLQDDIFSGFGLVGDISRPAMVGDLF